MLRVPAEERPRASTLAARAVLVLVLVGAGCGDATHDDAPPPRRDAERLDAPDERAAAVPAPEVPADAPSVVFLGDSIAAGLHLDPSQAFPAVLQRRLAAAGRPFRLVNAGVSGGTTAGGVTRLDWVLGQGPRVVVVELGANDGFRGVPPEEVEANLREIVRRSRDAGARVLLLGVRLPPNYGEDYVARFEEVYARVARDAGAEFLPYFMEGVAGHPEMNLPDGIHPTPEGHERLARNVEETLAALLR